MFWEYRKVKPFHRVSEFTQLKRKNGDSARLPSLTQLMLLCIKNQHHSNYIKAELKSMSSIYMTKRFRRVILLQCRSLPLLFPPFLWLPSNSKWMSKSSQRPQGPPPHCSHTDGLPRTLNPSSTLPFPDLSPWSSSCLRLPQPTVLTPPPIVFTLLSEVAKRISLPQGLS